METIGARLKKIRLEKGLSLEEVHRKTKIHLNILKAIEEDGLVNFSPVYTKGFLKIYCNFLGVDPANFLSDGKEVKHQAVKAVNQEKDKGLPRPEISFSLPPGLVDFLKGKLKILVTIVLVFLALFILLRIGKFIGAKIKSMPKKAKTVSTRVVRPKPEKQQVKLEAPVVAPKVKVPEAAAPEPKRAASVVSGVRLTIHAKEDCWMQVKIDGRVIFQNILRKGRSEIWKAKEKIELSLGNAGVVDLEVNDKLIQSLGRRGQQVKNILITKDGLVSSR